MKQAIVLGLSVLIKFTLAVQTNVNGEYIAVFESGNGRTWQQAEDYCVEKIGTHLASIHSQSDHDDAFGAVLSSFKATVNEWDCGWIGLYDTAASGNPLDHAWTDGTPFNYANWGTGEPNNNAETVTHLDCRHANGEWNDWFPYETMEVFVCDKPRETSVGCPYFQCPAQCDSLHLHGDDMVCEGNDCLENCHDGCILDCDWWDYQSNGGCQANTCTCHANGCDQCQIVDNTDPTKNFWKLNFDFKCQECGSSFPNCLHCSDFHGCQQCDTGFTRTPLRGCGHQSDQYDPERPVYYCLPDGEEPCTMDEEDPEEPPVPPPTDCFTCAEKCTELTHQHGCGGNDCLDTCRNCISDCDWWDYQSNGGCQDNECQCHANGCDQCEDGWFKVNYDFPCQKCQDIEGCMHCTDFLGCQQCETGYVLTEDPDCGKDSYHYTDSVKVHYCKPIEGECGQQGSGPSCPFDGSECYEHPCDCSVDSYCDNCQPHGCESCQTGYYKKDWNHYCATCQSIHWACQECGDWHGCSKCQCGYKVTWDTDCGINTCEYTGDYTGCP